MNLILHRIGKTKATVVEIPKTCKVPSWGSVSKTAGVILCNSI